MFNPNSIRSNRDYVLRLGGRWGNTLRTPAGTIINLSGRGAGWIAKRYGHSMVIVRSHQLAFEDARLQWSQVRNRA